LSELNKFDKSKYKLMGNECYSSKKIFDGGQIYVELSNRQVAFVAGQVIYGNVHVK
jgi:hypothetical protein